MLSRRSMLVWRINMIHFFTIWLLACNNIHSKWQRVWKPKKPPVIDALHEKMRTWTKKINWIENQATFCNFLLIVLKLHYVVFIMLMMPIESLHDCSFVLIWNVVPRDSERKCYFFAIFLIVLSFFFLVTLNFQMPC